METTMTDIAAILDHLVPQAKYSGSLRGGSRDKYEALRWDDEREKPSWETIISTELPDPPYQINKNTVWSRMNTEEAQAVDQALKQQPTKVRRMWDDAVILDSADALFGLLEMQLRQAFGQKEAKRLIAPEGIQHSVLLPDLTEVKLQQHPPRVMADTVVYVPHSGIHVEPYSVTLTGAE